jgi:DNA-3-methyladenine glycosylase
MEGEKPLKMKLPNSFYTRDDVVQIAKELLGKYLCTNFNGILTTGIITETEAYKGIVDRASHSFNNRFTQRTQVMYLEGGVAYVYLCYGIHSLFNVVTNIAGIPDAVLIRAIKPEDGLSGMLKRTSKTKISANFGIGPGNVCKILGIHYSHTGLNLSENKIWLEDRGVKILDSEINISTRIGVHYAGEDAKLPYRFRI